MVRLKSIRDCLTPRGQTQLSYHDLMLAMFDIVEGQATPLTTAADTTSMLHNNGKQNLIFFILPASLATSCPSKLFFCPVSTLMMINSRHLHWSFLTQCILTLWFRIFLVEKNCSTLSKLLQDCIKVVYTNLYITCCIDTCMHAIYYVHVCNYILFILCISHCTRRANISAHE